MSKNVSQNALEFEKYLEEKEIQLEKNANDDLTTFFFREQIGAPNPVTIGVMFLNHDGVANIVCYQFLKNDKPKRRQALLELVNTLNVEYTFIKYNVKDDLVTAVISVPFLENFSPALIASMISSLINALKKDYPRLTEVLA